MSIALCVVFPGFVESAQAQGATYEVLERLDFFAEMHEMRTFARVVYAVSYVSLDVDAHIPLCQTDLF